jgi:hypothetical protein
VATLQVLPEPSNPWVGLLIPISPAAVVTFVAPGLRFFHQGQFEGRKKRL